MEINESSRFWHSWDQPGRVATGSDDTLRRLSLEQAKSVLKTMEEKCDELSAAIADATDYVDDGEHHSQLSPGDRFLFTEECERKGRPQEFIDAPKTVVRIIPKVLADTVLEANDTESAQGKRNRLGWMVTDPSLLDAFHVYTFADKDRVHRL